MKGTIKVIIKAIKVKTNSYINFQNDNDNNKNNKQNKTKKINNK